MTATKLNPSNNPACPNVYRLYAWIVSSPTVESRSPRKPTSKPFIGDEPDTLTIIVSPNKATTANSEGPNLSANLAKGKEKVAKQMVLTNPPNTDQMVLVFRAKPE